MTIRYAYYRMDWKAYLHRPRWPGRQHKTLLWQPRRGETRLSRGGSMLRNGPWTNPLKCRQPVCRRQNCPKRWIGPRQMNVVRLLATVRQMTLLTHPTTYQNISSTVTNVERNSAKTRGPLRSHLTLYIQYHCMDSKPFRAAAPFSITLLELRQRLTEYGPAGKDWRDYKQNVHGVIQLTKTRTFGGSHLCPKFSCQNFFTA